MKSESAATLKYQSISTWTLLSNLYTGLQHIEEVFERSFGGQVFSKHDLPDANLQVELDDESKRHVVITTHRGLYRYNPLCFGLSSALAYF